MEVAYSRFEEAESENETLELQIQKFQSLLDWLERLTKVKKVVVILFFKPDDNFSRSYLKEWNRLFTKALNQDIFLFGVWTGDNSAQKSTQSQDIRIKWDLLMEVVTDPENKLSIFVCPVNKSF